ncbi:MAG: iron transporter [Hyphomicrobiales bacterium]|nr:iron transporter [Hyphomicrobiales bacterium]
MTDAVADFAGPSVRHLASQRRWRISIVTGCILVGLVCVSLGSLTSGAVRLPASQVFQTLMDAAFGRGAAANAQDALIVMQIRLPRLVLGLLVGAALAVSGALMQGLFRNPLADPGLVGVSSGAGLAAAATIVLGHRLLGDTITKLPFAALPAGAFLGGLATTIVLYVIATRRGRTSIATMLLGGVAIGALAGSLTGLLAYASDDTQLRDLTFWSLGALTGATWSKIAVIAPILLPILIAVPMLARGLNGLMMGEAEAYHLGISVQRIKRATILLVALATGASVAAAGVIGFVGIVVPHMLRLVVGSDHRVLLPLCGLAGAALLCGADIVARTVVAPAELPIGIVTAAIGAPFFLWLLLRQTGRPIT